MSASGFRTANDGVRLRTRHWESTGDPRSAVIVVHGLAEHSGRYEHVGRALAARGHDVRATDLRGFGESEGRRAFISSWQEYLDDLSGDVSAAAATGLPVVLLGHSLGGLIAASYALDGGPAPDFLVLSAPAVDSEISAVKRILARLLGRLAPTRELDNGIRGDQLSHDPAVGERYFADPLVYPRTTLGMGRLGLVTQASVRHRIHDITQPTLVIHGGDDSLVPPPISVPFAAIPHVERIELPGLRHETFNEDGGVLAIDTVAGWIERQVL